MIWMVVVRNGCSLLGVGTLKPVVSLEGINGTKWFLMC